MSIQPGSSADPSDGTYLQKKGRAQITRQLQEQMLGSVAYRSFCIYWPTGLELHLTSEENSEGSITITSGKEEIMVTCLDYIKLIL